MSAWGMSKCPVESPAYPGILPTTPPPPPPPDLHAALDKIDVRRAASLLHLENGLSAEETVRDVINAIREQLPPPVAR